MVGANIRSARLGAGLTQSELAGAVGGIQVMAVSNWERGVNRPNDVNLVMLSQVLGQPVAWFYADHTEAAA